MKTTLVLATAFLLLAGCAAPPATSPTTSYDAVQRAAAAAPDGVFDTYALEVRATGREHGHIYLNSEMDYRDQRNVTVEILPTAIPAFRQAYGQDADTYLQGRRILVSGEAKRVTIWFFANGKQTDKYYYQTHILVADPSQIQLGS
ncbi:hypothetical protein [Nitrospirillum amazonense]|uniref:Uncharacterized protein n=1 Tax=Nitrospirillum amazonense TaxID=28077 RepID=A0A560KHN9_9PROT|nr:hypothetical protein [Nitrospirillum amazonense]MDG3443103.1 hypothetical protein [Nitrospirillum amazonense]TWB82757.1 hypothetical protein FBZ87_101467 [Nitrospirillum amazonense]